MITVTVIGQKRKIYCTVNSMNIAVHDRYMQRTNGRMNCQKQSVTITYTKQKINHAIVRNHVIIINSDYIIKVILVSKIFVSGSLFIVCIQLIAGVLHLKKEKCYGET